MSLHFHDSLFADFSFAQGKSMLFNGDEQKHARVDVHDQLLSNLWRRPPNSRRTCLQGAMPLSVSSLIAIGLLVSPCPALLFQKIPDLAEKLHLRCWFRSRCSGLFLHQFIPLMARNNTPAMIRKFKATVRN